MPDVLRAYRAYLGYWQQTVLGPASLTSPLGVRFGTHGLATGVPVIWPDKGAKGNGQTSPSAPERLAEAPLQPAWLKTWIVAPLQVP